MSGLLLGLLAPLLGTVAGAAFVFLMRGEPSARWQKLLLGFASGVMVAASVWSLLLPAIDQGGGGWAGVAPVAAGFLAGMGFLLLVDVAVPHLHLAADRPEGPRSRLSRTAMLSLAVTIHNLPEGMAVGIALAGAAQGAADISVAAALMLSLGIAIQNVPEGAIVAMPLRASGGRRWRSFLLGSLSGAVEPLGGAAMFVLASSAAPLLPVLLAFAAGAMCYVVVEELIPEASAGRHSNLGTLGFAAGFVLMMVLDTVAA